jgi:hypothetical protein
MISAMMPDIIRHIFFWKQHNLFVHIFATTTIPFGQGMIMGIYPLPDSGRATCGTSAFDANVFSQICLRIRNPVRQKS